jgi:glycosyltransferase involved in cell wall biosynthesis
MSTRNDPIATSLTFNAFREDAQGLDFEFVIVDNSDTQRDFEILQSYLHPEYIQEGKLILLRNSPPCLFTAREKGLQYARGDVILLLDSHMLPGYGCCRAFMDFFQKHEEDTSVGFVYGPCGYHHKREFFSFHSRKLDNFGGIIYDYNDLPEAVPISFRGPPMAFRKEHFERIEGYGTFSRYMLSWGGGDTHLGLKSLVLGYRNWLIKYGYAIHLGPFPKGEHYFTQSFSMKASSLEERWIGFLIAAYIAGGEPLLRLRKSHVEKRLNKKLLPEELVEKAVLYAAAEKASVDAKRVYDFEELRDNKPYLGTFKEPLVSWYKNFKDTWRELPKKTKDKQTSAPKRTPITDTRTIPNTDWRAKIRKSIELQRAKKVY